MKRYVKIYIHLIKINFTQLLAFRAEFVMSTLSSLLWGGFSVLSIYLLSSRTGGLYGWTQPELILLVCVFNVIVGIYRVLFEINFHQFSQIIHRGQLDGYLLRPIDSQFQLSLWYISFSGVMRLLIFSLFVVFMIHKLHLMVSLLSIIPFLLVLVAGVVIFYSINYMTVTFMIWFSKLSNLLDLVNTLTSSSRYPQEMFQEGAVYIFFILFPILIVTSTSTHILLGKSSLLDAFIVFLFAVIFFMISRFFWKFALRFYTSASG